MTTPWKSPQLPTFPHREFAREFVRRSRHTAKRLIAEADAKRAETRLVAQFRAIHYLIATARPRPFIVHESRNFSRRAGFLDYFTRR